MRKYPTGWSITKAVCLSALCAGPACAHDAAQTSPLIELRQYVTYPGQRDVLVRLFEDHFIEPQEKLGMSILGTFREPEHPSHFTWLRGFADMDSRAVGLNAFYSGPVWTSYRNEANPTMEDSDNVLLLREAYTGSGFALPAAQRAPIGSSAPLGGLVVVNIYYLKGMPSTGFTGFFQQEMLPGLNHAGIQPLAMLVPETTSNNYPKLRIREGENLFVWVARYADAADYQRHLAAFERQPGWRNHAAAKLAAQLASPPEILKLQPTARSLLR
jgi:NIPSNAP